MKRAFTVLCLCSCLIATDSFAGSATWSANPVSADWNTAANWTPATVPNDPVDVATFADSQQNAISLSAPVAVDSIVFGSEADAFTINVYPLMNLAISGSGIVNNSGALQTLIANPTTFTDTGGISFANSAGAGSDVAITVLGSRNEDFGYGGEVVFRDSSSADDAIFDVIGSVPGAYPASLLFLDSSTAANATIALHQDGNLWLQGAIGEQPTLGNAIVTSTGGLTDIFGGATAGHATINNVSVSPNWYANLEIGSGSTAGDATITNQGATAASQNGSTLFIGAASGGNSVITCNGGDGAGKLGGYVGFGFINATDTGTADHATLIANGGTNSGNGGLIVFTENAVGGVARCKLFANGTLDISHRLVPGITTGSIEGDGVVSLGARNLTIGANDLKTLFSGVIQDGGLGGGTGGSLTKIGTALLTLTGSNTYTGGTTINSGTLKTGNTTGSATGTGPVSLNSGILGGQGTIAGPVTIGSGIGPGAILAPGAGSSGPRRLTLQSTLIFKADGDYACQVNTKRGRSDAVIANGVVIEDGAQFAFGLIGNKPLNVGKVFTIISNTSATPISGTFANLADGAIVTVGVNKLQVSYSGGDGNDLTLTVVP